MADEKKNSEFHLPDEGEVTFEAQQEITEEDISNELDFISIKLDGLYSELTTAMQPFQKEWDAGSVSAIANALKDGAAAGGGAWLEGLGDIFDGATWEAAGRWISNAAASVNDRVSDYAVERYKTIEKNWNDGNYWSWAWWSGELTDTAKARLKELDDRYQTVKQAATETKDAIDKAAKLWGHREAVANLPELIARGDIKAIQTFVDTVLMDIDPELAQSIKGSKEFHAVLELINDPDSVLTYLAYVSMVLEAIPLNFYAYIGGKAGTFIVCEIILLLITALLSAGAATAARVTALGARLAATSVKAGNLPKTISGAVKAIKAFELAIRRFVEVAGDLQKLGHKLLRARQRGFKRKTPTKTTLAAKRETTQRDRRCRICRSATHKTPAHFKRGDVTYYTPIGVGTIALGTTTGMAAAKLTVEEREAMRKAAEEDRQAQQDADRTAAAEENEHEEPPGHEPPETDDDDL